MTDGSLLLVHTDRLSRGESEVCEKSFRVRVAPRAHTINGTGEFLPQRTVQERLPAHAGTVCRCQIARNGQTGRVLSHDAIDGTTCQTWQERDSISSVFTPRVQLARCARRRCAPRPIAAGRGSACAAIGRRSAVGNGRACAARCIRSHHPWTVHQTPSSSFCPWSSSSSSASSFECWRVARQVCCGQ